jgi:hypothetical protein
MAVLLAVMLLPQFSHAQNKTISGKITDINGNPIPGATISVNKTNQGTTADANGHFSLSVPSSSTVTISVTGYKPQTINANDAAAELQIKLEEDVAKLEEVVVTGLTTTVKRRNLANNVGTISSKELNGVAPAQTFDAALNGKVAGAYINANSGAPGGGISVKLRGVTSFLEYTTPVCC